MRFPMRHCLLPLLGVVLFATVAHAQIPERMSYQGLLTDPNGQFLSGAVQSMTFRLYDAPVGGTVLWTETQPTVEVTRGLFGVTLGSVTPLTLPFNRAYYLGVTVGSGSEMSPRTELFTSPYSFRTHHADSADAVPVNAIGTANVRDGSITTSKINSGSAIAGEMLVADGAGGVRFDSTSSVGTVGVVSINGQGGEIEIVGGQSTTVTRDGKRFTVNTIGNGTITSINSADGAIAVTNPTGPSVTLSLVPFGISEPLMQDNAISTRTIRDGSITSSKLAAGVVNAINIADSAVTTVKLASNSVTTDKILDGSIITQDLADNSVTSPKIIDGQVMAVDLADGSVITSKLNDDAVTGLKIADGSIMNADVHAAAAISYSKLNLTNSIVSGDLADGAVTDAKVGTGITYTKIGGAPAGSVIVADGSGNFSSDAAITYDATSDVLTVPTVNGTSDLRMQSNGSVQVGLDQNNDGTTSSFQIEANGSGADLVEVTEAGLTTITSSSATGGVRVTNTNATATTPVLQLSDGTNTKLESRRDGTLLINGAASVSNSRLTVNNGHVTSQQTSAPTSTGTLLATATLANHTDVAGSITVTPTAAPSMGGQVTVVFNMSYATDPIVTLTAGNSAAAGIGAYVTPTTTGFTINFMGAPEAGLGYKFYYQVIETQ